MSAFPSRRFLGLLSVSIFSLLALSYAGTFKNPELIATSYDPIVIAAADFNHDGNLDVVYIDGVDSYTLHVLLGNGDGTFSHGQDTALPVGFCAYQPCVINLGDANHDGVPDLILGGTGVVAVLLGNGDGTFQQPMISTVSGCKPDERMGVGDINEDGFLDLVAPDVTNNQLCVLLGDGTGNFQLSSTMFSGYFPTSAYLTDLNGDGHLDLVAIGPTGASAFVYLGNGNGTFQTGVHYSTNTGTQNILLGDVDNDGHPDLIANVYPGQIYVFKGNPDGTFAAPVAVATVGGKDLLGAVNDYNGDGIADVVFLTAVGIGILPAKGNLKFGAMISSVSGSASFGAAAIASGDFNKDGHADIAMAVEGGIAILEGQGDGTFLSADLYDVGHPVGVVAVADFNGDKVPDIAVTVPAAFPRLLVGTGKGTFSLAADQNRSYGTQFASTSLAVGDFNGDGKNDLSTLDNGEPVVLFGAGNGTFATPVPVPAGSPLVGDVNNDGRSDMVYLGTDAIVSLLGQKDGSFTQASTALSNTTFGLAALGDLNHDGKTDLLAFEYPLLRVWLGNGNGTFTQSILLGDPNHEFFTSQSVAVADMDGDGNADVVILPNPDPRAPLGPITIFYGHGDGTFEDPVLMAVSHGNGQLVIADVNRDNKPDLVMTDGSVVTVITNLGGREFGDEEHYVAGQGIVALGVTDLNGDGFPDIVAANSEGTTVTVLLNQPNGNPVDGAGSNGVFSISPEPAPYSQPITLSMTMSASGSTPTGSVTFNVDGGFIATVPLVNGTATYAFGTVLETGTHTFVATYDGDDIYRPESFSVLHVVSPPVYATQTNLMAVPNVLYTSQTISLTAMVTSTPQAASGMVTFMNGTRSLGAKLIDSNAVALFDTALLTAGTHQITAVYQGYQEANGHRGIFQPSASSPVTVTVNATQTTTGLSASSTSITVGSVVTFTANVTSGSAVPFGGATFYDGTVPLWTSSLEPDGSASFSTASLAVGTHSITAGFNANATFGGSTSAVVIVTVKPVGGGVAMTVVSLATTDNGGQPVLVAKVSAAGGSPAGAVVFLGNGNILGSATTDGAGMATLAVPPQGSGTHNLSASFAGALRFAPSVSPTLLEQWPASGPGFSLRVALDSIDLTSAGSQPVLITIVPTVGFERRIQLSCADGLPLGYRCSFSSPTLYGGHSYLQIQPASTAGSGRTRATPLYAAAAGIFSLILIGGVGRRRAGFVVLLIAGMVFTTMSGCGGPAPSTDRQQMTILSIRATAGSGANVIVHSAQILAITPASR